MLSFRPHSGQLQDFLVAVSPTSGLRERMAALGAVAEDHADYVLFSWGIPRFGRILLGSGIVDGRFVVGPREIEAGSPAISAGTSCLLAHRDDGLFIEADPQGQYPLFLGGGFITNRLHLAAHLVRSVDPLQAVSGFFDNRSIIWDQPTQVAMPVQGVELLPPGVCVVVADGSIRVETTRVSPPRAVIEPDEYWRLIESAASEICANVEAVLDSGYPVLCDLSGGQDSRILLGALIASGRVGEVAFNTQLTPNRFGERDLAIGSGLVRLFGGTYEFRNPVCGYTEVSFDEAWSIRRSQLFGTYHFVPPTFLAPGRFDREQSWVRMGGACGEIYRDAFPSLLRRTAAGEMASPRRTEEIFRQRLWGGVPNDLRDDVVRVFAASFCALEGSSLQEKLNTHHRTFRSRFHFGNKLTLGAPSQSISVGPLYSPSLLAAVRGLPAAERATGRAVFDITKTLCEALPYYPHDKPKDPVDTDSRYHRPSPYDGSVLDLPDGNDLLESQIDQDTSADWRRGLIDPPSQMQAEFFDDVVIDCLDFFRNRGDWSQFLGGPAVSSLLDEDFADNRVGRLRVASKLQFVRDLVEICDGVSRGRGALVE